MRHAPQQHAERRLAARGLQQGLQRRKAIHGLLTRAGAAVAPPDLRAMRSDRRSQRCGIGCGKRKYGLLRAAQMPAHRRQQQRECIQRALVRVHAAGRLQHLCLCLPSCILQLRRCSAVQPEADHPAKPRPERLCAAEHEQKVHIRVCAIRACVDKAGLRGKRRLLAKGIRRQIAERCAGEFCEPAGRLGADSFQPMRAAAGADRNGSAADEATAHFRPRELFSRGIQYIQIVEPPDLRRLQLHADVLERLRRAVIYQQGLAAGHGFRQAA